RRRGGMRLPPTRARPTRACAREGQANMSNPAGCLRILTAAFMSYARSGDVEGFRSYLCSEAFMDAFNGLDPRRRRSALRCYTRAEALCEAKAPYRLIEPKPIH